MTQGADFGARLELALKALNISRGRLAAEARIDKSLVSRWLRGQVRPRGHNLEAVTALIGQGVPGFTQLSWELPTDAFARLVGAAPPADGPSAASELPQLPLHASRAAQQRALAYEGFWRAVHPSITRPGAFMRQYAQIRREDDGLLHVRIVSGLLSWSGPLILVHDQLYGVTRDEVDDAFGFFILNGVAMPRAEMLDGLVLVASKGQPRTPSACPYIMERDGDLTGDRAVDDARLEALRQAPVEADDLSEELRRHLTRPTDPDFGMLRLAHEVSRSHGVNFSPPVRVT
jgi:transcriptional regulator with XRE-family HTH domain